MNKTPYFGRKVSYAHLQPRDPGGLKNYNKKNSPQYIHHNPKQQQYYFPITFTCAFISPLCLGCENKVYEKKLICVWL